MLSRVALRSSPLYTPRLCLMPIDPADTADLWIAIDGSRTHLYPWLPWVPYNTDEAATRNFVEACVSEWDAGRAFRFVIRDRHQKRLVGVVGLEACVHAHRSCEIGYWLSKEHEGKGLMTEAARQLIRVAFEHASVHRIRVAAATTNHRSLAVIGRLGFRFEGIARQAELCAGRWLDHGCFGLLSTDSRDGW